MPVFAFDNLLSNYFWLSTISISLLSIISTSATTSKPSIFGYKQSLLAVFVYLASTLTFILSNFVPSISILQQEGVGNPLPAIQAFSAGGILSTIMYLLWVIVLGSESSSFISQLVYNNLSKQGSRFNTGFNGANAGYKEKVAMDSMASQPKPLDNIQVQPIQSQPEQPDFMPPQSPAPNLRAKALYSYSASAEDPNEISFEKGDVFDVLDNKGKWWQVKKANGEMGIAPSNYLQLLQ